MNEKFALGELVRFREEPDLPYKIVGINRRYAIATRPITDMDREAFDVPDEPADTVIYTIVDNETWRRGPDNFAFSPYDYAKPEHIRECLSELELGNVEVSRRRSIPCVLCDDE